MSNPTDGTIVEGKHYESAAELSTENKKYWHQRYDLFSRYDEDIWMTEAAWYGVTPEVVADKIAAHVAAAAPANKTVLIDTFGGVGGNALAFARSGRWDQIFAIEKDEATFKCAKHNAKVYGVENKIWWTKGDSFQTLVKQLKAVGKKAVIFGSPPWGGPGYRDADIFKLETMQPYSLRKLYDAYCKVSRDIVLYLPRTSDLNEIAELADGDKQIPVTHYCMRGASKALCVYLGDFTFEPRDTYVAG